MKNIKPIAAFVGLVILIILGSVVYLSGTGRGTGKNATLKDVLSGKSELVLSDISNELLSDLLQYRFTVGKAYRYTFTRNVKAAVKDREIFDIGMDGMLSANVVAAKGNAIDLIIQIIFQKVRGAEIDLTKPDDKKNNLINAVHLRINRQGKALLLRFPPELAEKDKQDILKDLIANWLRALPNVKTDGEQGGFFTKLFSRGKGPYETRGADSHGEFLSESYLTQTEKSKLNFDSKKMKYSRSSVPITIDSSKRNSVWNWETGAFTAIYAAETLLIGAESFRIDSVQSCSYELKEISESTYDLASLSFFIIQSSLHDSKMQASGKFVSQIPTKSWEELKAMLTGLKKDTESGKKHDVFNFLTVSMKRKPEMARQAVLEARKHATNSDQFQMIMGALSFSGSPIAQEGLRTLYTGGELDRIGMSSVLDSFTMMNEALTAESRGFLTDVCKNSEDDELKNSAALALASSLRNAKNETDQEKNDSERIRGMIREEWRSARSVGRRIEVLDIIGNSGDDSFLDIIREAARDSRLVATAIYSVRFMNTEAGGEYLLKTLNNTASVDLKNTSVKALAMHTWRDVFYEPLLKCVQNEKSTSLRIRCSDYVLEQDSQREKMQAALRNIRSGGVADKNFKDYIDQQLK